MKLFKPPQYELEALEPTRRRPERQISVERMSIRRNPSVLYHLLPNQ
jgi:hypothetical protein